MLVINKRGQGMNILLSVLCVVILCMQYYSQTADRKKLKEIQMNSRSALRKQGHTKSQSVDISNNRKISPRHAIRHDSVGSIRTGSISTHGYEEKKRKP